MTSIVPTNIADSVRRMDSTHRFMVLASLLGAGIVIWAIVSWATKPTFISLFPGQQLTLAEAASVTERLESEGIDYRLEGTMVKVPQADAPKVRMDMAAEDLGIGACGNVTDFSIGAGALERKLKELQTIRAQLECTIGEMHAVEKVRVQLVIPEGTAFINRQSPKAAVAVWPRRGVPLGSQTVTSITYLVSGAVPELAAEDVAVLDGTTGRPLNIPGDATTSPVARSRRELEARIEVEEHLITKVREMLSPILPPAEFQVQVSADLDWTALQRTSEQFDPNAQAIVREESNEVPPGAVGPGSPAYNSAESESRYSRTVESITNSPGSISRLSVAVFVNERAPLFGGNAETPPNPNVLAQQTSRIEEIVRSAVAFNAARGDQIVVNASPFWNGETVDRIDMAPAPRVDVVNLTERLIRPVIGLIGIVVVLLLGLKAISGPPARRRALAPTSSPGSSIGPPTVFPELEELKSNPLVDASLRLQKQVAKEAEGNPDTTARVIQAWLTEPAA